MLHVVLVSMLFGFTDAERQKTLETRSIVEWDVYSAPLFPIHSMDNIATRLLVDMNQMDADTKFALYNRRAYCRLLQLRVSYNSKLHVMALADFSHALALRPNDLSSQLGKLIAESLQKSDLSKTLKSALRLQLVNPRSMEVAYFVGVCQLRLDNASEAILTFSKCLENDSNYGPALMARAAAKLSIGKYHSCIDDLRKSLSCVPHSFYLLSKAFEIYGLANMKIGKIRNGEKWLLKSYRISVEPSVAVRKALWLCCSRHGKFAHSLFFARELTTTMPKDPSGYWMYALSSIEIDQSSANLDRSLNLCRKSISLNPNSIMARRAEAIVEHLRGNVNVALHKYKIILKKHPGNPDASLRVAFILATDSDAIIRSGKVAIVAARASLRKFKSKEMRIRAMAVLAMAHAENNEFKDAVKTIDNAIKIGMNDSRAVSMLKKLRVIFEKKKPYRPIRKNLSALFVLHPSDLLSDTY